jgi:hypothetical protein
MLFELNHRSTSFTYAEEQRALKNGDKSEIHTLTLWWMSMQLGSLDRRRDVSFSSNIFAVEQQREQLVRHLDKAKARAALRQA